MKQVLGVTLLVLLAMTAVAQVRATASADDTEGEAEDEAAALSTDELDTMVADVLEADAEEADTEAFESTVAEQNVDSEHAAVTEEVAVEAAHEFETETGDEVEADASASEEDNAIDHAAQKEVAAAETEAAEAEAAEAEEDAAAGASFVESESDAEAGADADADVDAETDTETEAEAGAHTASELATILSAKAVVEFEEDTASDAADDAEDAAARAEEQAYEARFASSAEGARRLPRDTFDERQAKEMFVYAQAAYFEADPSRCVRKLTGRHLKVAHTVASEMPDGASIFGMTAIDKAKQRLVVAFNGNIEPSELSAQLTKGKPFKFKALCKSCKTHRYYVQAYKKICPQITASMRLLLSKPEHAGHSVWITGHGFGGAMAALCAFEIEMARVFSRDTKRVVITFGQPRTGNAHWARKFNQHFPYAVRVTHSDDPMPHVPPCYVNPAAAGTNDAQTCFELKDRKKKLWAFHSPTQVWYSGEMPAFDGANLSAASKGQYTICNGPNWGEDPKCRNEPLGLTVDDFRNYYGVDVSSHCANLIDPPSDAEMAAAEAGFTA